MASTLQKGGLGGIWTPDGALSNSNSNTATANRLAGVMGTINRGVGNAISMSQANPLQSLNLQARTPGADGSVRWDTSLDSHIGELDNQIKTLQGVGDTGSAQPEQLKTLQTQRQQANAQRWASANLGSSPGGQHLQQLLQQGALSYADLGSIDISLLNNDAGLASAVDQLMASKAAPPPTAAAPGAGDTQAVDKAAGDAQHATTDLFGSVNKFANSALNPNNPDSALGQFDKTLGENMGKISGAATHNAHHVGAGLASSQANHAGTNLQANATQQRDLLQKDSMSHVQDFINSAIQNEESLQQDLSSKGTEYRLKVQSQGLQGIQDEIKKAIDTGKIQADAKTDELTSAISAYNAQLAKGEEDTQEHNRIIGLVAGFAMGALGAGAAASGVGAPAAPFLIGAGGATIARNAGG